jgi:hypothetical protein
MAHHAARMASGRMMRPLGAVFLCLSLVLPSCTSPGLERTPHAGLGVSRAMLQAVFARPESAFICGAPHESRGVPSPGGNGTDAMVKVWGEAREAAGGESQPIALWAWSALVEVWRQGAEAPRSAGRLPWRGRGWGSARWRRPTSSTWNWSKGFPTPGRTIVVGPVGPTVQALSRPSSSTHVTPRLRLAHLLLLRRRWGDRPPSSGTLLNVRVVALRMLAIVPGCRGRRLGRGRW